MFFIAGFEVVHKYLTVPHWTLMVLLHIHSGGIHQGYHNNQKLSGQLKDYKYHTGY
jgi:hypothetical protein